MKKLIATFIGGGFLGFVAGAGLMLVFFPFFFPPAEVNEKVASNNSGGAVVIAEANFRTDSPGQDAGHWGKGGIKIYQNPEGNILLELQDDFEVGPGPNFWIYLNGKPDIEREEDFQADKTRVKAAKLKSFTGSQVYELPAADYKKAKSITIWCESFNQYIASANLPPKIQIKKN